MTNNQIEKSVEETNYLQLVEDLRIKSNTIAMGERIAWGSDSGIMDAAADAIDKLTKTLRAERTKRDEMVAEVRDEERRICKAKNLGKVRMFHPTQEAIDEVLTEPTSLTNDK